MKKTQQLTQIYLSEWSTADLTSQTELVPNSRFHPFEIQEDNLAESYIYSDRNPNLRNEPATVARRQSQDLQS